MIDVDEQLRVDSERWRAEESFEPDLGSLVTAVTRADRQPSRRLRVVVAAGLAAAAVAVLSVSVYRVADHSDGPIAPSGAVALGVPESVRSHGQTIPFVGRVPWRDPIVKTRDDRHLVVFADNQHVESSVRTCGAEANRVRVIESRSQVRIVVAGYAQPLPQDLQCAAIGLSPVPVRVTLQQPLGHRQLVDTTTGLVHRARWRFRPH